MKKTVKNLLAIAESQLGYHEKSSIWQLDDKDANAGPGNFTRYARDLAEAGYYQASKQGYDWCDVFVDHCFWELCGRNRREAEKMTCQTGLYGAGCRYSAGYYREQGRYFEDVPQPGDQIFFGEFDHTGIVETVEGEYLTTIEGNAGDQVTRGRYRIGDHWITGFGRPYYEDEEPASDSWKAGDLVEIQSGAHFWNGEPVPDWVMSKQWILYETPHGKRAVIHASSDGVHGIMSPISTDFLIPREKSEEPVSPDAKPDYAMDFTGSLAGTYRVRYSQYLRTGAAPASAAICRLNRDESVQCYGYHTDSWLYVQTEAGKTGFCLSGELQKL